MTTRERERLHFTVPDVDVVGAILGRIHVWRVAHHGRSPELIEVSSTLEREICKELADLRRGYDVPTEVALKSLACVQVMVTNHLAPRAVVLE